MHAITLLTTLITLTIACQSLEEATTLAQVTPKTTKPSKTTAQTTKPTSQPKPRAIGTVATHGKNMWYIQHKTQRLCLPAGLYQQKGIKVSFDPMSIVPPRPNERRWCLNFDTSTLALHKPSKTIVKTGLTTPMKKNAPMQWSYTYRVPRGPSAMGSKTTIVCIPEGFTPKPRTHYITEGYVVGKHKSGCEQRVFTAIKVHKVYK